MEIVRIEVGTLLEAIDLHRLRGFSLWDCLVVDEEMRRRRFETTRKALDSRSVAGASGSLPQTNDPGDSQEQGVPQARRSPRIRGGSY